MKRLTAILAIILSACLSYNAGAQDYSVPKYEISKERTVIGGVTYYVHRVEAGQTIYSICKLYGIPMDNLVISNPVLKGGLKAGSMLFIPVNKCNPVSQSEQDEINLSSQQRLEEQRKQEKAKQEAEAKAKAEAEAKAKAEAEAKAKAEAEAKAKAKAEAEAKAVAAAEAKLAAERLKQEEKARKEAELQAQREAEAKAKAEAEARVKAEAEAKAKAKAERIASIDDSRVITHKVKWFETLSSISRKYGIDAETIMLYNDLSNSIVLPNDELRIPLPAESLVPKETVSDADSTIAAVVPVADAQVSDSMPDDVTVVEATSVSSYGASNPLDITLILPFKSKSGEPSSTWLDFYSGVLMALKDAKDAGRYVNLHVIDFSDGSPADIIYDDSNFSKSNLIIGPVEARDIPQFASYALEHSIPFVSPMDHKADTLAHANPYFFQLPVSSQTSFDNLAARLKPEHGESVIMIHNSAPSASEKSYIASLRSALKAKSVPFSEMSYTIQNGRTMDETFKAKLSHKQGYKVIVASEEEAFASDIVRNMNLMHLDSIHVSLYGSQKLRNFEAIDAQSLYDLGFSYSTNYYVDYNDEATRNFVLQYRALYKAEPTPYSFHGYDTFTFFITSMYELGGRFMDYVDDYTMNLLQSNIHFQRVNSTDGFRNMSTRDIEMAPGYIVKVK